MLLVVDWHQVLHVHRVLPLLVRPDADRREAEQDGGDQGEADTDPGNNVGPVVLELSVVFEILETKYFVKSIFGSILDIFHFDT